MDSDQLKDILNNEDKFDQFIRDLPQLKALQVHTSNDNCFAWYLICGFYMRNLAQEEKEMLLTSNKSLAEYNLSQEPQVRLKGARRYMNQA